MNSLQNQNSTSDENRKLNLLKNSCYEESEPFTFGERVFWWSLLTLIMLWAAFLCYVVKKLIIFAGLI